MWHTLSNRELLRITVPNMTCHSIDFMRDGKSIISGNVDILGRWCGLWLWLWTLLSFLVGLSVCTPQGSLLQPPTSLLIPPPCGVPFQPGDFLSSE